MNQPPLDYRRPGATDVSRVKSVRDHLRHREAMLAGKIFTLLAIGVPLLFIGPFLMACIFWFVSYTLLDYPLPWTGIFWGLVVTLIPLLLWTERRTRGTYFADTVIGAGGASSVPYLAGPELGMLISFATSPRVAASGFVELFLVGPRFVLEGLGKLRGAKKLRGVSIDRAATIVADLRRFDTGVPIHQLAHEGEHVSAVVQPLAYLLFHDWVGISATGDRVWLLSESKRALNA
jgi:hypothetical protein